MKTDPSGAILWLNSGYNDNIDGDPVMCVSPTDDGGCVTTNLNWHTIRKYDSQGKCQWSHIYGYLYEAAVKGESIQQTQDGGYTVTGSTYGMDLFLLKTDSNGDALGISEPVTPSSSPVTPVTHQLEITNPIGSEITLRYSNCPNGFAASVFDASGRKVAELHSSQTQGTIQWGGGGGGRGCYGAGVYFIVADKGSRQVSKVVLVK